MIVLNLLSFLGAPPSQFEVLTIDTKNKKKKQHGSPSSNTNADETVEGGALSDDDINSGGETSDKKSKRTAEGPSSGRATTSNKQPTSSQQAFLFHKGPKSPANRNKYGEYKKKGKPHDSPTSKKSFDLLLNDTSSLNNHDDNYSLNSPDEVSSTFLSM